MKVEEKAFKLWREGKVRKELETERRIHFSVEGEEDVYSVIFDKSTSRWECDCQYWSLRQKACSHIKAAMLYLQKLRRRSS